MDLDSLISQYKDVDRAGIADMDTLMTGTPLLAKEVYKLQEKVRKFEKRYPSDGSESEYDKLKNDLKNKEKELQNVKTRQKSESVILRKEMGKTSKMLEDLRIQADKEKKRADNYNLALKQSELIVENMQKGGSSDVDKNEIKRLRNEIYQKQSEIDIFKSDGTAAKLNNEINILQNGLSRAELELNEFKNKSDHEKSQLKRKMDEAVQDAINSKNALELAEETIKDLNKRVSNDLLKREIERLKKELESKSNSITTPVPDHALHEDIETLHKMLEKSEVDINQLKEEKSADRLLFQKKMDQARLEISRLKKLLNENPTNSDVDSSKLQSTIISLKTQLDSANSIIDQLKKHKPPTKKQGKSGDAAWEIDYDEEKNRLLLSFNGKFTYSDAKKATRNIESVLNNVKEGFDAICDVTKLKHKFERKTSFQIKKIIFVMQTAKLKRMVRIAPPEKKSYGEILNCVSPKNRYEIIDTTTMDSIDEILQ